jgi:DNA topoisomerase IA
VGLNGLELYDQAGRKLGIPQDHIAAHPESINALAEVLQGFWCGKVQSVSLNIIVTKEREITTFISEPYWSFHSDFGEVASDTYFTTLN